MQFRWLINEGPEASLLVSVLFLPRVLIAGAAATYDFDNVNDLDGFVGARRPLRHLWNKPYQVWCFINDGKKQFLKLFPKNQELGKAGGITGAVWEEAVNRYSKRIDNCWRVDVTKKFSIRLKIYCGGNHNPYDLKGWWQHYYSRF